MPSAVTNNYDALENEVSTRKQAVRSPQDRARLRLEQRRTPEPTSKAHANLAKFSASAGKLKSSNRSIAKRLLGPEGPSTPTSRLQRPQHFLSSTHNGVVGRDEESVTNLEEMVNRLSRAVRSKDSTIKELAEEVERYKGNAHKFQEDIKEAEERNKEGNSEVSELAYDLDVVKKNLMAAKSSLEEKTREVEQQALAVAALRGDLELEKRNHEDALVDLQKKAREVERLDEEARLSHEANVRLGKEIEEMNRLAAEQQQQQQEEGVGRGGRSGTAHGGSVGPMDGEGDSLMLKELEKLKQIVEMRTKELESVKGREERSRAELLVYRGQARTGFFKSFLLKLWWFLRAVGFLVFLLFVYVALSEDALRSRGVDVYRVAH